MQTEFKQSKLIVNKIIYAKRVATSKEQIISILNLEIETHLRNNPDLIFKEVGKAKDNDDKSKTFPLEFMFKPVEKLPA